MENVTNVEREPVVFDRMSEDSVVRFLKEDLPKCAFPIFEDIRRQGKLCDVTLKVINLSRHLSNLSDVRVSFFFKVTNMFNIPDFC